MNQIDYRPIDKDTAEWHELTNKQKIEWVMVKSRMFDYTQKHDYAANVIHAAFAYHVDGGITYEEALELMVITFHGQLNDMAGRETDRLMRECSPQMRIK